MRVNRKGIFIPSKKPRFRNREFTWYFRLVLRPTLSILRTSSCFQSVLKAITSFLPSEECFTTDMLSWVQNLMLIKSIYILLGLWSFILVVITRWTVLPTFDGGYKSAYCQLPRMYLLFRWTFLREGSKGLNRRTPN